MVDLDGLEMYVSSTAANDVVDAATRLTGSGTNVFDECRR